MISIRDLKSRKLVQWALAYLAGAWLVLQLLELLAQPFAWPDLVLKAATVLLAVGLLAALVVAWYHGEKGSQRVGSVELLMLTGILVVAGAAVALVSARRVRVPAPPVAATAAPAAGQRAAEQGSIAVLPFVNMSSDPEQEFFSDGLTEELLNALAQLPELRVASRTSAFSFKGEAIPLDSIARALRVANVLEGSVRKAGDRVRITAQLISATTGYHLWSGTYDREIRDVFAVQDEISRAIVRALQLELSVDRAAGRLVKEETVDPEAHALVLRGQYLRNQGRREGLETAVGLFREAIRRDPRYARAHAGLAEAYATQAYYRYGPHEALARKSKEEAARALELDSTLAEAHFVLGRVALQQDLDLRGAEAHLRRAIELNPGPPGPYSLRAWVLMDMGRSEEAIALAKHAVEIDPVSSGLLTNLGSMYFYTGQTELAANTFEAALALEPDNPITLSNLAQAYSELGRHEDAMRSAESARDADPEDQFSLAVLAFVAGRAGRVAEARSALEALEDLADPSFYMMATAHAGLGDTARVFENLARAVDEKSEAVADLAVDPVFDPYRSDPRMEGLLERLGLR